MDWSHVKVYQHWLNREHYEVHRYFVPHDLQNRLKFIRKYFKIMDRVQIPHEFKRRKNGIEHVETAVMMLGRIDSLCVNDIPIIAGSGYLSKKPWAIFGEVAEPTIPAKIYFRDLEDIANYYSPLIVDSDSSSYYFNFRVCPTLAWSLADRYNFTVHFIISCAICLLSDILMNCGPDCEEFYDLFTNDTRDLPHEIDINDWQTLRCKTIGKRGYVYEKRHPILLGQIYEPSVKLTSRLTFDELSNSDDLESGEKTIKFTSTPSVADICLGGKCDENVTSIETDEKYLLSVKDNMKKYEYLVGER